MPRQPTDHQVLQQQVTELLQATGWSWLHVRRSIGGRKQGWVTTAVLWLAGRHKRMERGWPDLIAWSPRQPGRMLALELKVPPDRLTPEQIEVLTDLAESGWSTYVITRDEMGHRAEYPCPWYSLVGLAAILAPADRGGVR